MEHTLCVKDHIQKLNKLKKNDKIFEINKTKNKYIIQEYTIDCIVKIKKDENLIWIKTLEEGDEGAGNRNFGCIYLTKKEARKAIINYCLKNITYYNNQISLYINTLKNI